MRRGDSIAIREVGVAIEQPNLVIMRSRSVYLKLRKEVEKSRRSLQSMRMARVPEVPEDSRDSQFVSEKNISLLFVRSDFERQYTIPRKVFLAL
ncbi:MAG: hypothetical protein CL912_28285 [Deltaproteobacteria bacterium]|nr:hypothetical protein [Deltaproteobacteria bacterium]